MTSETPLTLRALDGHPLSGMLFEAPTDEPLADVVLHSAMAVSQTFYAPLARFLASRGLRVLTYDYRGIGASRAGSLRGCPVTMEDWFERDAPATVRALTETGRGRPLLAIGHSLGGQLAATIVDAPRPCAIVHVTAQSGYHGAFPDRRRLAFLWRVAVPALTAVHGYFPAYAGLGADVPKTAMRTWAGWNLHPEYYLSTHPEYAARLASFEGALYSLSFTDDSYAPLANVCWLLDKHEGARRLHHHLTPEMLGAEAVGHFGAFRRAREGDVWEAIASFLEAVVHGDDPRRAVRAVTGWPLTVEPLAPSMGDREVLAAITEELCFGQG